MKTKRISLAFRGFEIIRKRPQKALQYSSKAQNFGEIARRFSSGDF